MSMQQSVCKKMITLLVIAKFSGKLDVKKKKKIRLKNKEINCN